MSNFVLAEYTFVYHTWYAYILSLPNILSEFEVPESNTKWR